jgi:hypothetical protein
MDFFDFMGDIGSIAFWGLPQPWGWRPGRSTQERYFIPILDKSFKNLVAGM